MKKLTLLVLTLGMTFGAFAQMSIKTPVAKETTGLKAAGKIVSVKPAKAVNPLKTASLTLSDLTFSSETDSGFNADITVTPGTDCEKWMLTVFNAEGMSEITDQQLINYFESYNQYYAQYSYEYYMTPDDAGTFTITGFNGNSSYQAIAIAINGSDTVIVRGNAATTPSSVLSGTATCEVSFETAGNEVTFSILFGDQTRYVDYWLNSVESDEQLGFSGNESDIEDFFTNTLYEAGYSSYIDQTTAEIEESPLSGAEAGTEYECLALAYNGNGEAGEGSKATFILGTSSLNDVENVSVSVYPNPASEYVAISSLQKINNVEIVNTLGQVVYSDNTVANAYNIPVSNLANGTYFVKVKTANKVSTSKIIVK